jgi:predicted RNA-binding protein YlxR (DUF448 family)
MANQPKVRKIPMRRCVGCAEHFPKTELIRVVRSPDGVFSLDTTGRAPGRGAYLCNNTACLQKAKKTKRLEAAFSSPIEEEVYLRLEEKLARTESAE